MEFGEYPTKTVSENNELKCQRSPNNRELFGLVTTKLASRHKRNAKKKMTYWK